ncbi:MAG: hypothetical protein IZT60_04185 [Gammaproteobacteria bacterium]|nr:hypothetical protein [Gammaproteobacteria bacterium]
MKIIGGNFGVKGSAFISRDKKLVIEGAQKAIYSPQQVLSVSANVTKEKKFGILGFIVGAIVLSIILGLLLNVLGVVIALVIAVAGSFYSEKTNIVEVKFNDNKSVSLESTPRGVKKLVQFAPT